MPDSPPVPGAPTVALIAHDQQKEALRAFCVRHRAIFARCRLIATGTTGQRVAEATGAAGSPLSLGTVRRRCADRCPGVVGEGAAVIFLVDSLYAHLQEPDIRSLLRVCNVHNVPPATNLATAEGVIRSIAETLGREQDVPS